MYKTIIPTSHDEWLKERTKGIGSSEIGALLGLSPWQTPYQLWQIKTGKVEAVDNETNLRLRAGHVMESEVAAAFEATMGLKVEESTAGDWLAIDPKRPFLRVSPDRLYKTDKGELGVLECKTTSRPMVDIPANYFAQVQYQLAVTGYDEAYLAVLNLLSLGESWGGFKAYRIAADRKFQAFLIDKAERFWNDNVRKNIPPAPMSYADIAAQFPTPKQSDAEISEQTIFDILAYKERLERIKALQAEADGIKDRIACAFGDNERLVQTVDGSSPKVYGTFKAQTSNRVDTQLLKERHPDIYNECLKQSTSRVLRLK